MGKNAEGREAMLTVTLRPDVRFSGDRVPTPDELAAMHHEAHEECFIANSVKTEVRCEQARVGLDRPVATEPLDRAAQESASTEKHP